MLTESYSRNQYYQHIARLAALWVEFIVKLSAKVASAFIRKALIPCNNSITRNYIYTCILLLQRYKMSILVPLTLVFCLKYSQCTYAMGYWFCRIFVLPCAVLFNKSHTRNVWITQNLIQYIKHIEIML